MTRISVGGGVGKRLRRLYAGLGHRSRPGILGVAAATSVGLAGCTASAQEAVDFAELRRRMVRDTIAEPRDGRPPVQDASVIESMEKVERHLFVPEDARAWAYRDSPLGIGWRQTISQPYIVALMTELAAPNPGHKVLEIGTGSGYQAAVLAEIVDHVYTIEIVEPLGLRAAEALEAAGYENVTTRIGDGYAGWPEEAPFDAIVVTAAPDHVPQPLIEQLAPGGRLVLPVGPVGGRQELQVLERTAGGEVERTRVIPVRFVPLTRNR
ncbi:MAG: protein-L-isoaspartate(D-aspartate) O-methyltransferase [Acidobacteria bacterium]|nr:protein-L-isoaspartate(D-aspartate) O-methyltransferase [Acidobacteriota bacterium]